MVNLGFWGDLKKPILCLAPMADVTDSAFRHVIAKYSKSSLVSSETTSSLCTDIRLLADSSARLSQPAQGTLGSVSDSNSPSTKLGTNNFVMWTEFVSADGLVLAPEEGRKRLMKGLEYTQIERPIVAQFFTSKPENMEKAARLALELGFDGVDINMGCPDKSIEKQGAGASMMKNPELAKELIIAAKQGASNLPVSVKTRLGYNKDELEEWLRALLAVEPAVITIHARTRKEMSKVPAHWDRIKRAVEIRDEHNLETLIFGNGDIENIKHAHNLAEETGCDGVMLGRAIFGNPFLFNDSDILLSVQERLLVLVEHSKLFEQKFFGIKSFAVMKKHFKAYLNKAFMNENDPNILHTKNELSKNLMNTVNASEVEDFTNDFLKVYNSLK